MFVCNDRAEMTLSQLALTVLLLAGLGLAAHRLGVSAIPAYLLSGLLLGPHEPHLTSLITSSDVSGLDGWWLRHIGSCTLSNARPSLAT